MEGLLDMVEEGKVAWKDVIRNFYPDLDEAVKRAEIELESVKIEDEVTDVICEECGRNMVIKYGPLFLFGFHSISRLFLHIRIFHLHIRVYFLFPTCNRRSQDTFLSTASATT